MEYRPFGNTGLTVSVIGFGAGHIGSPGMDEKPAARLLNEMLDLGINLLDTARSYGESERMIGRYLSHRRHEFVLSTKVGYSFQDKADWSFEATMGTVEESLKRLQTDYLDIVHLHSCEKWILESGESILALEKARDQGKILNIAYSGENEALEYAIDSNRFGCIQCSVNVFDQNNIDRYASTAHSKGMGVIAKRPLGNTVWRYESRPDGHGHAAYWDRMQQLDFGFADLSWGELALRFTAFTPGVGTLIAGTSRFEHLKENLKIIEKGPLDKEVYEKIRAEYRTHGQLWSGVI